MSELLICVLTNLFRMYLIYKFIRIFEKDRKHGKAFEFAAYLIFFLINTAIYLFFHTAWMNLVCNLVGIALLVSLYTTSLKNIIFEAASIYLVNACCDILSVFCFSEYIDGKGINQFCSIITVLLILICELITGKWIIKKPDMQEEYEQVMNSALLVVPISSIIVIGLLLYVPYISDVSMLIVSIGLLIINFLVFYLYDLLIKSFAEKYDNELLKQQVEVYAEQLKILMQGENSLRGLRHDMKHHINELRLLAQREDTEHLKHYLSKMEDSIKNPRELVNSGNMEMDSVFNYLIQNAIMEGIKVSVKTKIPKEIQHSFDVITIFGNLMDNAVEAAKNCTEQYINIFMEYAQGVLRLEIANGFQGKIQMADKPDKDKSLIITRKKPHNEHGIGLKNVKRIVEQNNGSMDIQISENQFIVKVMMYLTD